MRMPREPFSAKAVSWQIAKLKTVLKKNIKCPNEGMSISNFWKDMNLIDINALVNYGFWSGNIFEIFVVLRLYNFCLPQNLI